MVEGINMGRKSPWTKEEYISAYNEISDYAKRLSAKLLISEGAKSAAEAMSCCLSFYPLSLWEVRRLENG